MTLKIKTQYDSSKDVSLVFKKPSLTDQQFKDECDLVNVVEKYAKYGIPITTEGLQYGDVSTFKDYQDSLFTVANYKSMFESLPSKERDKFGTVDNFVEFICNPDNLKESVANNYIDSKSINLEELYSENSTSGKLLTNPAEGAEASDDTTLAPSQKEG